MELTASDWSDLRLAAIMLAVCIAIECLLVLYFHWRKGDPPFKIRVLDPWWIAFGLWLFALAPILERRGLPAWVSILIAMALFLGGMLPHLRRIPWDLKPDMIDVGLDGPADQTPRVLLSEDEKKLATYFILAIVGGVIAAALAIGIAMWATPGTGEPVEAWKIAIAIGAMTLTLGAFVYPIFGRWPGKVSCSASIDIAAAQDPVWDAFALRDDYAGWKGNTTRIERLHGPGEVYRVHYAQDASCLKCSLPKRPDQSQFSIRIEILKAHRPSTYHTRAFAAGVVDYRGDSARWFDSEDSAFLLQPLANGDTRVSYVTTVFRPKALMAILVVLGGPAKENLRSLKAHLEGMPDESTFGISAKRIEAARNARAHCRCPAPL